jgi:uncharacterized protein (DUF2141 family)
VPEAQPSATFPLRTDFGHGQARKRQEIAHLFGDESGKLEQRFYVGPAARRYTFLRKGLKNSERKALAAFWEQMLGSEGAFFYDAPQEDQTFQTITAYFENAPLTLDDLADHICSVGLSIVEIPTADTAPIYSITGTDTRFPSDLLATALSDQVQEIIPIVRIRVTEAAVPDIFLSDRMVTVGDKTYLPRLLGIGDPGSSVLVSQSIDGQSDDVQFTFGNADRVMVQLANDTELKEARIELSLFHVGSGIKLDLWAGQIVDWASDKGPEFTVQASDIITALTLQSPVRNISRTCWRIVGDINYGCPATPGSTCDLTMDGLNGCKQKGGTVKLSFGGQSLTPQAVTIKDNSTGTWGFGRDLVTPTSQINDTVYGGTLPEIWHNDDGIPQRGLPVQCRMVDGREESDFYEGLGIVGRGPIGAYTVARMYDSDGDGKAETFLGSTLDGQPHHGFKQTNASGAYTDSGVGLRKSLGTDPATANDYFSLDRTAGTPGPGEVVALGGSSIVLDNYAAGVAFLVIRRTDQKGIQPSEISSHQMTAMIAQGLTGLVWAGPGSRSSQAGCTNPVWIAINTVLRSLGVDAAAAAVQEDYFDVAAAVASAAVADASVTALLGSGSGGNSFGVVAQPWAMVDGVATQQTTGTSTYSYQVVALDDSLNWLGVSSIGTTSGANNVLSSDNYVAVTWSAFPGATKYQVFRTQGGTTGSIAPSPQHTDTVTALFFNDTGYVASGGIPPAGDAANSSSGAGNETQFRFKGTIDTRKSLRDRLTEILNNCLGYYTWEFGKLKIGVRTSANPEANFQPGNMIFGSLKLTPLKPTFEKLTVEFADTEFLFAKNTVDYTDLDYALRNNRVQNPKTSQIGLIGSSTKSQAGRIAVIRTREELGGVGATEQKAARVATWRTTILGLDTQAGQVVRVYDSDIPGGSATFRIQSWRLNRDWSLDITAQSVTASMYDLASGSVVVDVAVTTQPTHSDIDQGPPPAPLFSGQVAPDDAMSAEVYNVHFASTVNTRTITQGTFTFYYHDPTITADTTKTKTVSATFPYDFFLITPPATTYQQAALDWVLKTQLPGMLVTQIDGFVSNVYGDSPVTSITVSLQLGGLPKTQSAGPDQYVSGYDASTSTFTTHRWVVDEKPGGTQDGSNRSFTLANTPLAGSTQLFYNGVEIDNTSYTVSGAGITLGSTIVPPNAVRGSVFRASYRF